MKILFSLIAVLGLAVSSQAQFTTGPGFGNILSNATTGTLGAFAQPFKVEGLTRSNLPITTARIFPVGAGGVQLFAHLGNTNALTVTNVVLTFEIVSPRTTNGLAAPTFAWNITTIAANGRYSTNFSSAFVAAQLNTVLANAGGMRLLHVTNHNSESIWFTNLDYSAR